MTYEEACEKLGRYGQLHVLKYYEELAEEQKEALLAQIDAILEKSADSPAGGSDGSRNWMNGLDFTQIDGTEFDEVGLEIVYDPEAAALSYQIPVNEKQALEVGLVLTPDRDEGYYEIKKWQLVNTRPREGSQPLQLMPMPE